MKKSVLLVLIVVFLTGCVTGCVSNNVGTYISVLPIFVLPDDTEFVDLVKKLETPEEICQYMEDNFEYDEENTSNLSPYELFKTKKGNCDDFSSFVMFILIFHGYDEVYQILIELPPLGYHMIAVFKEGEFYNISDNMIYIQCFCKDFREIMNFYFYHDWVSYVVYDYDMNIVEEIERE